MKSTRYRTSHRPRVVALGSVLAGLALLAAACGTSSSSGSTSTTTGGGTNSTTPTTTPGVTKSQIVLGATAPLTGPAAPGYSEIAKATNAVFQYINAKGGVNGRQIKYIVKDDAYNPTQTITDTRQLVAQDQIFASVGALGTPTQQDVESYLKAQGVPQLFVESGCACWNDPSNPNVFGLQPNYIVEGKILGQYVSQHFAGQKVGYLSQNDEFGQDGLKGLDQQIPSTAVVNRQTYEGTLQGLASGLGNQISALQQAGAKVVVLYTIPAATALALLAAAEINYHPQWVVSNVGADVPTLTGLLSSFSGKKAGASLLNGMISNVYFAPQTDASNPWVKLSKKILSTYAPSMPWDGNTEFGTALGFIVVQLLQDAGANLTRQSLVTALETKAASIASPGITPLTYSTTNHSGYEGVEIVKIENSTVEKLTGPYLSTNSGPITAYTGGQQPIPAIFGAG
jgi:ABC-type branched-subunit amino acid transport system substrate-binding protein